MDQTKRSRLMELIALLNRYYDDYHIRKSPTVTDEAYDRLYVEMVGLQAELNIFMANSPVIRCGKPPEVSLEKIQHKEMFPLPEKIHDPMELVRFQKNKQLMLMLKPDGVSVKLVYEDYFLVEASTYGDGITGENFLHNVYGISGIPIVITRKERVVVTGEVFICPSDFEELKQATFDGDGRTYPNVCSFAAGALSLPDTERCRERRLCFLALRVLEGLGEYPYESQRLAKLPEYGFDVCKHFVGNRLLTRKDMERGNQQLRDFADANDIPFGGILANYNDAAYARSCKWAALYYVEAQPLVDPMVLKGFLHFVGKDAMNIAGLSKGILEQLIARGLLQSYADIYSLDQHRDTIIAMNGFSEAVWQKLWDSIMKSRNTKFERLLLAMNIPAIDHAACKTLAVQFHGDPDAFTDAVDDMFDFRRLPGFVDVQHESIYGWFWNEENYCMWFELRELFTILQTEQFTQAA